MLFIFIHVFLLFFKEFFPACSISNIFIFFYSVKRLHTHRRLVKKIYSLSCSTWSSRSFKITWQDPIRILGLWTESLFLNAVISASPHMLVSALYQGNPEENHILNITDFLNYFPQNCCRNTWKTHSYGALDILISLFYMNFVPSCWGLLPVVWCVVVDIFSTYKQEYNTYMSNKVMFPLVNRPALKRRESLQCVLRDKLGWCSVAWFACYLLNFQSQPKYVYLI